MADDKHDDNQDAAAVAVEVADLTLPASGLLRVDVGICFPWEAPPSSEPLRLMGARVLMR